MDIVVTGGAGFIGSHLCEKLKKNGHNVYSIDDYSTGSRDNHVDGVQYTKDHTVNIGKYFNDIDIVYHLGEYARVSPSFIEREQVFDKNITGTLAVLEFCLKNKAKLVYSGSSTKFADGGLGRDQSPYAWSKATNTDLIKNYGNWFGLKYSIAYFYNVYGPRERTAENHGTVIATFLEKIKNNQPLPVVAPGTQVRNYTHVSDIVDGLILVGEQGIGDDYGIGSPESYTLLEVAAMFNGIIEMLPRRKGDRLSSFCDTSKVRKLGWEPKHHLDKYIQYERSNNPIHNSKQTS